MENALLLRLPVRLQQHPATPCNTLQHTANFLENGSTYYRKGAAASAVFVTTATHCNTLQRTATHCDTLQH